MGRYKSFMYVCIVHKVVAITLMVLKVFLVFLKHTSFKQLFTALIHDFN